MKRAVKNLLTKTLNLPPLSILGEKLSCNRVPIFMMHRFECSDLGINGHDLSLLRYTLEFLRKRKFNLIDVDEIARSVEDQTPLPEKSLAFTIDDGYWDHVEGPAQLFAEYDCPTTYFVATGFISKELWLWDSKVEYLLDQINQTQIIQIRNIFPMLALDGLSKQEAVGQIVFELANHPFSIIEEKLNLLSAHLEVDLPIHAPEKYQSTSWPRLKEIERMGMRIAPHSYSHPILANENNEKSYFELEKSRDDVNKHIKSPSNIFCYPVGRDVDFGERECQHAKELGFTGAVSAAPPAVNLADKDKLFQLPRFAFPNNKSDIIQYATWIETFKGRLRR